MLPLSTKRASSAAARAKRWSAAVPSVSLRAASGTCCEPRPRNSSVVAASAMPASSGSLPTASNPKNASRGGRGAAWPRRPGHPSPRVSSATIAARAAPAATHPPTGSALRAVAAGCAAVVVVGASGDSISRESAARRLAKAAPSAAEALEKSSTWNWRKPSGGGVPSTVSGTSRPESRASLASSATQCEATEERLHTTMTARAACSSVSIARRKRVPVVRFWSHQTE